MKAHAWLSDIDWSAMAEKQVDAPYKPGVSEENYDKIALLDDTIPPEEMEEVIKHAMSLTDPEIQAKFSEYYYLPIGKGLPIPPESPKIKKQKSARSAGPFSMLPKSTKAKNAPRLFGGLLKPSKI